VLKTIWRIDVMKFRSELLYKEVYVENLKVGIVTDIVMDAEEWKITHFEVELSKEASKELLGAKGKFLNVLSISAVAPASKWSNSRVDLQVSKAQLHMYLRPP
jgi:sporulation protein YlmC with PRC-barrel domain